MLSGGAAYHYSIRAFAILGAFWILELTLRYLGSDNLYSTSPNNSGSTLAETPGPVGDGSKALVVASMKADDTTWIHEHLSDWDANIYVSDDRDANMTVLHEGAHEAVVYLTYIIQHYYKLPEFIVFMHARRYQWHNDDPLYDGVPPIKNLRLEHVRKVGYQNLRCAWSTSCHESYRPHEPNEEGRKEPSKFFYHLKFLFPGKKVPKIVRNPCCATFAVHRSRILARRPWEWERFRQGIWDGKFTPQEMGTHWEYSWHMIMGKPAQYCVHAEDCYCQAFGLCNLDCPDQTRCKGRWQQTPFGVMVPVDKGWPNTTGIEGYPKGDWYMEFEPFKSGKDPKDDPKGLLRKGTFRLDLREED